MKHIILFTSIVAILMITTSCSRTVNYINSYDEINYCIPVNAEENNSSAIQLYEPNPNQAFIDDLDHLIHVIKDNFTLLNFVQDTKDFNLNEAAEKIYNRLIAADELCAGWFQMFLSHYFAPLISVGHFNFVLDARDDSTVAESATVCEITNYVIFTPIGDNVPAIERRVPLEDHFCHRLGVNPFLPATFAAPSGPLDENWQVIYSGGHFITAILADENVAYMEISSLPAFDIISYYRNSAMAQIFSFYEQIQGFEHLIIDLRRNRGGFVDYFFDLIIAPNIIEPVVVDGFVFSTHAGRYAQRSGATALGLPRFEFPAMIREPGVIINPLQGLIPVNEMLEMFYLPLINKNHISLAQYGFQIRYIINPNMLAQFNYQPAFDGKIWLLTGPVTSSSAHVSAWIAHDSGFATLVGESTGGIWGGNREFARLPNSNIQVAFDIFYITDRYGYGIEAGIVPHYFSPVADALETTLALIAEGWVYGG